jgi:hypothetical protein
MSGRRLTQSCPDYFRDLAFIVSAGGPPDLNKINAVMARHGLVAVMPIAMTQPTCSLPAVIKNPCLPRKSLRLARPKTGRFLCFNSPAGLGSDGLRMYLYESFFRSD